MATDPISLQVAPQAPEPIDIDMGTETRPVPPEIADKRAEKAHFALKDEFNKNKGDYYEPILNGQENSLRQEVASALDYKKQLEAHQSVLRYISQGGTGPLTIEDANNISRMAQAETHNPDSVFEKKLAESYTNPIFTSNTPWITDAIQDQPQAVSAMQDISRELVSKYAYLRKWQEDLQQDVHTQSWPGFLADLAKQQIPLYSSIKTRGTIPGAPYFGGLLGSNWEQQGQELFNLPFDEMVQKFPEYIGQLRKDNPSLALSLVTALIGSTSLEQNTQSAMEAIDLVAGAQAAKGLAKGSFNIITGLKRAGSDTVRAAPAMETQPVAVTAAGAAGDMEGAAVKRVAQQIGSAFRNDSVDPIKNATESLTSNFKLDRVDYTQNPGRYGQEIVNRLNEIMDTGERNVTSALTEMYRVNRTPELAEEAFAKRMVQAARENYRGIDNQLLDVSDPIHHPESNLYYHKMPIGDTDGNLFKDYETAFNNAKKNGIVIRGPAVNARIAELEAELKGTNFMDADVHGLNYREALEREIKELKDIARLGPTPTNPAVGEGFDIKSRPLPQKGLSFWADTGGIEQQGVGYYIDYYKFVTEAGDALRDGLVDLNPAGNKLPPSWFGGWVNATVGWVRTPEETLALWDNEQRKIATHGPNRMLELIKPLTEPVERMPRKYWKDFDRFIKSAQRKIDPDSPNATPGYRYKSPGEIEEWYNSTLKRLPDKTEIEAYFAMVAQQEFDRVFRQVMEFSNRGRLGAEQHRISIADIDGNVKHSDYFDGIRMNNLPKDGDVVAIMGKMQGHEKTYLTNLMPKKLRAEIDKDLAQGTRKVIRVYNTASKPLSNFLDTFEDADIRYVVSDKIETKPLDFNSVPRRGGGHLVPDYDYYAKQADIDTQSIGSTRNIYRGDKTLAAVRNAAEGEQWAFHMNNIRKLLKDKRVTEAQRYSRKFMSVDWDKIHAEFKESHDPSGKKVPARISLDHDIHIVHRGQMIIDKDKSLESLEGFRDGRKSGNDAAMSVVEFTQPRDSRDLFSVNNKGTVRNPIFTHEPADLIDPVTVMNRGIQRLARSVFMDDYKRFALEHFMAQANPFLKASTDDLRSAPFYHLFKEGGPEWKPVFGQNFAQISTLKGNWKKIRDFIGQPSAMDTFLRSASEKLQDSIYRGTGPKGAKIADHLIPTMKDPLAFMRKITYHMKMGLFSIPQFFTQFTTHSNIFAISPRHAPGGSLGMLLHGWSEVNADPKILAALDKKATQLNLPGTIHWKDGWWLEARKELISSGFSHIGGENVFLDTPWSAKVIQNGKDKFLSWGEIPFKVGAKSVRTSAFYTSFLEWRNENPTAALTRATREKILNRATLLDHNQSRASASALHTGIMAVPFQFQAYALRLMEMFTGKRLTPMEKARLFGVSALLYGVPVGGLGLLGFPAASLVDKYARDTFGYVTGQNPVSDTLMHGLGQEIGYAITGNRYNIEKFGAKGLDPLENALDADKTWMDVFGGASEATAKNLWRNSNAYRMWASSVINNEPQVKPTLDDVLDIAKEITAINHLHQGYVGFTTGHWVSRNDNYLMNVSKANSVFMAMSGLNPLEVQNAYYTEKAIKEREAFNKDVLSLYLKYYSRGVLAYADKDQSKKFFMQANAVLAHYPDERRAQALQLAYDNNRPYIDRVDWNYFMKDVDPQKREMFTDMYRQIQELKGTK